MGVEKLLSLYGIVGVVCLFYLYKHLPETENKSLHDIEEYFKKLDRKTDEEDICKSVWDKLCPAEQFSSESKHEMSIIEK